MFFFFSRHAEIITVHSGLAISHEVHSIIRVLKSSVLEHWRTLQEGWVSALGTLYDLFLILSDNLLCKGNTCEK